MFFLIFPKLVPYIPDKTSKARRAVGHVTVMLESGLTTRENHFRAKGLVGSPHRTSMII